MSLFAASFQSLWKSLDIISESAPIGNKLKVLIISELSLYLFLSTFNDIFIEISTKGLIPSSYYKDFYWGKTLSKEGFINKSYN